MWFLVETVWVATLFFIYLCLFATRYTSLRPILLVFTVPTRFTITTYSYPPLQPREILNLEKNVLNVLILSRLSSNFGLSICLALVKLNSPREKYLQNFVFCDNRKCL